MSYDLTFAPRVEPAKLTEVSFAEYFANRPHYEMTGSQAWYANDDTGVYFSFEYSPPLERAEDWQDFQDDSEPPEAWFPTLATFNINFYRPSFFALEAEPEIAKFVAAFDLIVDDPQIGGMGRGEFVSEKFLLGWSRGNEIAYSAAVEGASLTYPSQRLRQIWQWNYARKERQAQSGDQLFVPKISFAREDDQLRSFAVWADGISVVIPEVDVVVVYRQELARRRWLRRVKNDMARVEWEQLHASFPRNLRTIGSLRALEFRHNAPSMELVEFLKSQNRLLTKETFAGVAPDSVLEHEIVAKAAG